MSNDVHAVPISGVIISEGKPSRCGCFIQYEINFSGSSLEALWAIAFENYYVATICIEQGFPIERDGNNDCEYAGKNIIVNVNTYSLLLVIWCISYFILRQAVKQVFDTPKSSLITT